MIYWIASYPRSGNTLLRIVIRELFGQGTYESEKFDEDRLPGFFDRIGRAQSPHASWREFETWARSVPEPVFVKTHKVPEDGNPVIFVLRDGRLSLDSYVNFHHDVLKNAKASLKRLILGDDYYGSWSEFCTAAMSARGKVLVLRFEEIVERPSVISHQFAEFTGLPTPAETWTDPFVELSRAFPTFFRKGQTRWNDNNRWSAMDSAAFALLHGEAMERLGYYAAGERDALLRGFDAELREYLQLAYHKSTTVTQQHRELEAKERVIQDLLRASVVAAS